MLEGADWNFIPHELKQRSQWCVAGKDKVPQCLTVNGTLYNASPVEGPWMDFNSACDIAHTRNLNIGYIITADDGLTCVDLDVKDAVSVDVHGTPLQPHLWTSREQLQQYSSLLKLASSYAELSASGSGLHLWVKGDIGAGRRGGGIEVYSKERFIICTGKPVSAIHYRMFNNVAIPIVGGSIIQPLQERQHLLQTIVDGLKSDANPAVPLVEVEQSLTDAQIWKTAIEAENSSKFKALCAGEYYQFGFPSQSEADLALMSMFTFYTKSNEQCRRLFRQTALGQRTKAVKNDAYLNRTLAGIRSRQAQEERVMAKIDMQAIAESGRLRALETTANKQATVKQLTQQMQEAEGVIIRAAIDKVRGPEVVLPDVPGLDWPPGIAGQLAAFIYNSSPRPVKEVAITATLGLLAGILGKAYHTPSQSGLNLYIILIARSAIGKESMHSGISLIKKNADKINKIMDRFIEFSDFVSGPALVKTCAEKHSFVNISGEWGRKLQRLGAEDGRDGPMQQLRTAMTNLYQKSGPGSTVGGAKYADKSNNVNSVEGISYSMIGETTPGTFYEALTPSMMEDGFLSRFTIIKYDGERPPANKNPVLDMEPRLLDLVISMCCSAARAVENHASQPVPFDGPSAVLFKEFDARCDVEINKAGDNETYRQMWNRAHLKAWRIACLLAVADNYAVPIVQVQHAEWAIQLVTTDIGIMRGRILTGGVGVSDDSRIKKAIELFKDFFSKPLAASYKIDPKVVEAGILPRKYLQVRTAQLATFTKHRLGATLALDQTIKSMIDSGYIMEVDKDKMTEMYNYHGRCFRPMSLPDN